jgi:aldehyde:ferredoxin oxidoreductase
MSSATVQYQALYGTAGEMWVLYKAYGDVPIKNFSLGEWDGVENIIGEAMAKTVFKSCVK